MITVSSQASVVSRAGFATSGGRFKDFEMSRPFKIKQSVFIAIFDVAQAALAPGVAVGVMYAALLAFGGVVDAASPCKAVPLPLDVCESDVSMRLPGA